MLTIADKGGAIVIVDVSNYVIELNKQLKDTHYLLKLRFPRNLVFYLFRKFNLSSFVLTLVSVS